MLYAGGAFTIAGQVSANNVARWDGNAWNPLGGGTNSTIYSLRILNDMLYLGGRFTKAGEIPSYFIACWHCCIE